MKCSRQPVIILTQIEAQKKRNLVMVQHKRIEIWVRHEEILSLTAVKGRKNNPWLAIQAIE